MKKKKIDFLEETIDETLETTEVEEVKNKKKAKKANKLRNQALLKRGGYAMAITAAVLAGIIILNVLVDLLAQRMVLEFDMTTEKKNSISQENIDYIKSVDKEINIIVCATEDEYYSYLATYAADLYSLMPVGYSTTDYTKYFDQTVTLINKYDNYNNKIKVKFVDPQSTEFSEIYAKYSDVTLAYGDIIVSCETDDTSRHKVIGFMDIYEVEMNETYATYYGMERYDVLGNNIETALTSAIAYVNSSDDKKVAFLTGHSAEDYSESYRKLLKNNNYEVDIISSDLITSISNEYDAIFIVAPTIDFLPDEIDVISAYLDDEGRYGKGLVFFADASSPYLPNLSAFLEEWGITVHEGIVFETDGNYHRPNMPTALYSTKATDDKFLLDVSNCLTSFNVPLTQKYQNLNAIETSVLVSTFPSTVNAPVGTSDSWTGAGEYVKSSFATLIQAKRFNYDNNNNPIQNYVFAFSSVEFIVGETSESTAVSNKKLAFKVAERAVGADESSIFFDAKTIETQSFATEVTETEANNMLIIFMIAFPLLTIAAGIYVYIRRRNS